MASPAPKNYFSRAGVVTRGELTPTESVICPICSIAPQSFAVDFNGFTLCRCPQCSLEFVSPRLTFDELAEQIYTEHYMPVCGGDSTADLRPMFERQMGHIERLVGRKGRILDIGCGTGDFLTFAAERGWSIAGADIMDYTGGRLGDCPMYAGRLGEIDFGGEAFDAVRMNHVIEHTQDPVAEMRICRDLLRPDGILFVSVPNIAGLSSRAKNFQSRFGLKSKPWRHYAALHHLFFFSPATLKAAAEHAGLRVVETRTPVLHKSSRSALSESLYRLLFEPTGWAGIVDVYCKRA